MGKKHKRRTPKYEHPTPEDFAAEAAGEVHRFSQMETLALMLESGIRLWFMEQEPLSIHLIASAVYRCLDDLADKMGQIRSATGHEQFTLVYDYLRHAWPNRDVTLVFPVGVNRWLLFEAINSFEAYFRRRSPVMSTFQAYFVFCLLPRDATTKEISEFLPSGVQVDDVRNLGRREFVDKLLPLFIGAIKQP